MGRIDTSISRSTVDDYCLLRGRGLELSEEAKREIIESRVQKLKRAEWQRWVPGLNFYRMLEGFVNEDSRLLADMHSLGYNVTNIAYSVTSTTALATLVARHVF